VSIERRFALLGHDHEILAHDHDGTYLPLTAGASKPIVGDLYAQGALWMESVQPNFWMKETDAAADSKIWRLVASGGAFYGQIYNDIIGAGNTWLGIQRSGITVTSIDLYATAFEFNDYAVWHSGNPIVAANMVFNNSGRVHGDITDFNATSHFGSEYIQSTTNGPQVTSATQYYSWSMGLGSNYYFDGVSGYVCQFAMPRTPAGGNPVLSVRFREAGTWGTWSGVYAQALQYSNTNKIEIAGVQWRITTGSGYGDIGPANTGYFHFSTDRAAFYFGQAVELGTLAKVYGTSVQMSSGGFYTDVTNSRGIQPLQGSYGAFTTTGSANGWAGIHIGGAYRAMYMMFNTTTDAGGFYDAGSGWRLHYDGTQWQAGISANQAIPYCTWGNRCAMSNGTAAPSGGNSGDVYYQYT